MNEHSTSFQPSDGIPTAEVWATLVRNWVLILGAVAIAVALGIALVSWLAPAYEARAQFRLGQVADNGLFEEPGSLTLRLVAEYGITSSKRESDDAPYLKLAQLRRGSGTTIELVAVARRPEDARALLEKVYGEVAASHTKIYEEGVAAIRANLRQLDANLKELSEAYAQATALIKQGAGDDPAQIALLVLQRGQLWQAVADLNDRRPRLVAELLPPRTQPTVLLGEIYADAQPASPKRGLILVAAVIFGLAAGVVLAFCRDRIRASRNTQARE